MRIYEDCRNKFYRHEQNRTEHPPLVFQPFYLNIFLNKKIQSSFRTVLNILKATFMSFEAGLTFSAVKQICSIDLTEVGQIPNIAILDLVICQSCVIEIFFLIVIKKPSSLSPEHF